MTGLQINNDLLWLGFTLMLPLMTGLHTDMTFHDWASYLVWPFTTGLQTGVIVYNWASHWCALLWLDLTLHTNMIFPAGWPSKQDKRRSQALRGGNSNPQIWWCLSMTLPPNVRAVVTTVPSSHTEWMSDRGHTPSPLDDSLDPWVTATLHVLLFCPRFSNTGRQLVRMEWSVQTDM